MSKEQLTAEIAKQTIQYFATSPKSDEAQLAQKSLASLVVEYQRNFPTSIPQLTKSLRAAVNK